MAEGVVDDISHEGLRVLLREEGVSFQRVKTWKASKDPDYAAKKARVEHLNAIVDREVASEPGEPEVIFCVDEFGPLNLQPRPGRQWAAVSGKGKRAGAAAATADARDLASMIHAGADRGLSRRAGRLRVVFSGSGDNDRPADGPGGRGSTGPGCSFLDRRDGPALVRGLAAGR